MNAESQALGAALLGWYPHAARRLPWRETKDPYAIWVSEVMLQQTRAETVVPYFERFLARFPNVNTLATAPDEDLLRAWSGLGYYTRARNLRRAARRIAERGAFPCTYEEMLELPGVGEYTAAAVASIAYGLPHAVLDGNVVRVMARLTCDFGDIGASATRKRLREAAEHCLLPGRAGEINQALMELGATVCLPRNPKCLLCPISGYCRARSEGAENDLPTKLRRPATVAVESTLLLFERDGKILLKQRPRGTPMAGFWDLPDGAAALHAEILENLCSFRHSIMNRAYRCTVYGARFNDPDAHEPEGYAWVDASRLDALPLSTMTRKALTSAISERESHRGAHEGGGPPEPPFS